MIYVLGGGSGGGSSLNFKIVGGTTQPSSPSENMIWVNTSTAISEWVFSAEQPHRVSNNKNLIVYPFYQTTKTESGITWTDNGDGTVKANGTATAATYFRHSHSDAAGLLYTGVLEPGTYILSGCPTGGSGTTYAIEFGYSFDDFTNTTWVKDVGSGASFTIAKRAIFRCALAILKGTTVSNIVFKPQLEKGSTATSFVKGDATGQVWFQTTLKSNAPFNALKKNSLVIYPVKCQQYIGDAWTNKTAKTYQDGAWEEWNLIVFKDGVWNGSYRFKSLTSGGNFKAASVNNDSNPVTLYVSGDGSGGYIEGIDVTNYSTLSLTFAVSGGPHFLYYGMSNPDTVWYDNNATNMLAYKTSIPSDNTKTTVTIDVSALTGSLFFKVYWFQFYSVTFSLYELKLE